MIAYHGNETIKQDILTQLDMHRQADELVKGRYWQEGKGCAVGCTLHSGEHNEYETRFGIPAQLAYLEDRLFESLENGDSQVWPTRFMAAIPVGADLSLVWPRFALWLCAEFLPPLIAERLTAQREAVAGVAREYQRWVDSGTLDVEAMGKARDAAADAAAYAAAYAAAAAAADAAAAAYAADAAYAAADAAAYAAYAAAADADDARQKAFITMADKLIELLEQAPVPMEVK